MTARLPPPDNRIRQTRPSHQFDGRIDARPHAACPGGLRRPGPTGSVAGLGGADREADRQRVLRGARWYDEDRVLAAR